MSSYTIRPATLRDARSIAALYTSVKETAYSEFVPVSALESPPPEQILNFWREAIEYAEPQILVAVDESGKSVGFVGYDRSRDKGTKPTVGEIWAIYVLPSHWDTGAGLALWDAAREGLQEEGCTQVTVWLPLRNERALRFHELAGFKRELNTAKTVNLGKIRVEEIRLKRATA